jgi:hypothetical protein
MRVVDRERDDATGEDLRMEFMRYKTKCLVNFPTLVKNMRHKEKYFLLKPLHSHLFFLY